MSKLRCLQVGMDWFPHEPGGLNRYFYGLVHALPTLGVEGTALVAMTQPGDTAPMRLLSMAPPDAGLRAQWRGARQIVREQLQSGVEVISPHFAKFAYPWARMLPDSVSLVTHFHGPWADEMEVERTSAKDRWRILLARHMERTVYRRSDRLITLSESFRDILIRRFAIAPERVMVVPGGQNGATFFAAPNRAVSRQALGWPMDRPILLAVRRLARRMGLEILIEAMQAVCREVPNVLLLLAGTGPIAGELDALIAQSGLEKNIRRLGFVSEADLPLAYAAADLTLVPTVALEGFGLITIESLASGTPVLGTALGGTPEILRGLSVDLLFDAPTSEAVAERLLSALRGRMALPDVAACRAYARQFEWTEIAPRVRDVYTGRPLPAPAAPFEKVSA